MAINGWKVVAWIFIILFILETSLIIWSYNINSKAVNNKIKCSNEICFGEASDSFIYDENTQTCSCYKDLQIIKQEVLP